MNKIITLISATATASVLALAPMALKAQDGDMTRQLSDARQEGSVSTAIATNRHLSAFKIDVDVQGDTAVLTGNVETGVDKDLAEQVALDIDGIDKVDNQLRVDQAAERKDDAERTVADRLGDSTTTATVKSKLLWNNSTAGLDIKVSTLDHVVTLEGIVDSGAAKELAERLAADTDGVHEVRNLLEVGDTEQVTSTAETAGDVLSDTWITSKVKSSFLFSRYLSGTNISVETRDGAVTLSGNVATPAEKDLAEQTARNVRGVREVNAGALDSGS